MKAVAVFPALREVRLIDHPEPAVASDREVKLRMLEVGVCGTDRDLCNFRFGAPPPDSDHFILGHESLAEVADAGDGVTAVRPGDLVVAAVRKPCSDPACAPCRSGRQDFCGTGQYRERGIVGMHGFMTEFVIEPDSGVHRVPPELLDVAVLIEPLTIAEKAFLQFQAIETRLPWPKERRTAVMLGAGPVGLLGAMVFRAAGFETWIYSRERGPNAIARAIGAQYVSSSEVAAAEFARAAGNIDIVYEAMGAPQTAFDVLGCLGANGVFVFTGVPPVNAALSLDLRRLLLRMIMRNQVILGTVNAGPDAFESAIRDLTVFHKRWPDAVRSMITGRFAMGNFRDAIEGGGIKNVICT
jgi:threonine dehydrogenase-like Zn-dependent dehydrogenase